MARKVRTRHPPTSTISIRNVAELAGVSVASVSRVINKSTRVSDAVTQRVQAAVRELNYVPNSAARALITSKTRIVGALIPSIAYSTYAAFIEALQHRLHSANHSLVLTIAGYDRRHEYDDAVQLIAAGAEALMLPGEGRDPALYKLLQARKIPYVLTSIFHPDSPHPTVGYDNQGLARRIANYLLDLGHQQIAVITGNCAKIDRFAKRVDGIRESLQQRSLYLPDSWIIQRGISIADGREAFHQLFSQPTKPTAVICGNDVLALGALLEAQTLGVKVPEELSIVGFDDMEWAAQMSPSLTTVHISLQDMGFRAADYLIGKLQGEPVPHSTKIEANLVLRESTGPCRQ